MSNPLLPYNQDGEPERDRVRLSNVCYVLLGTRDPEKVRDWINAAYAAESRAASSPSSLGSPESEASLDRDPDNYDAQIHDFHAEGSPPDIERLAQAVHEAYLEACRRLNWTVKPENRVTYCELSEGSKELDRASVRAVLEAIDKVSGSPPELKKLLTELKKARGLVAEVIQDERWDAAVDGIESLFASLEEERDRLDGFLKISQGNYGDIAKQLIDAQVELSSLKEDGLTAEEAQSLLNNIGSLAVSHPHFQIASRSILAKFRRISQSRVPEK